MKIFLPKQQVRRVTDIDPKVLAAQGIRGALIDLDNTLAEWNCCHLPEDVKAWLQKMKSNGISVCILSNNNMGRVQIFAQEYQLLWIGKAGKPRRKGFMEAMRILECQPRQTVVIGDQIFTDVLGGNRLGLHTILVDPISSHEFFGTRLARRLERLIIKR